MQNFFKKMSWPNGPWITIRRTPNMLDPVFHHLKYMHHKANHTPKYMGITKKIQQ